MRPLLSFRDLCILPDDTVIQDPSGQQWKKFKSPARGYVWQQWSPPGHLLQNDEEMFYSNSRPLLVVHAKYAPVTEEELAYVRQSVLG